MAILDLTLSEKAKKVATLRAAAGKSTLDAYIESLIIADAAEEIGLPEHLSATSEDQLVSMLQDGTASEATTMSINDWDEIRRRVMGSQSPSSSK